MVGSPAFCSPEQLRGEELSAIGYVFGGRDAFYLLTGRVPFEGHNIAQLTANVLEKPVPSPRNSARRSPGAWHTRFSVAWRNNRAERFKSYDDLRQAWPPDGSTAPTPATLSLRFLAGAGLLGHQPSGARSCGCGFGNPMDWLYCLCLVKAVVALDARVFFRNPSVLRGCPRGFGASA